MHALEDMARDPSLIDTIEALIGEQRRTALRARTIAVTLKSALDEFDQNVHSESDPIRREAMRREWCERAQRMILDVRVEALRIRNIGRRLASQADTAADGAALDELEALVVASETADVALDVGERIALEGLADAS